MGTAGVLAHCATLTAARACPSAADALIHACCAHPLVRLTLRRAYPGECGLRPTAKRSGLHEMTTVSAHERGCVATTRRLARLLARGQAREIRVARSSCAQRPSSPDLAPRYLHSTLISQRHGPPCAGRAPQPLYLRVYARLSSGERWLVRPADREQRRPAFLLAGVQAGAAARQPDQGLSQAAQRTRAPQRLLGAAASSERLATPTHQRTTRVRCGLDRGSRTGHTPDGHATVRVAFIRKESRP